MTLSVGKDTFGFDITGDKSMPTVVEQEVMIASAGAIVSVSFDNDFYDPNAMLDRKPRKAEYDIHAVLAKAGIKA